MSRPILYSFRRCPYAMRARLAVQSAGIETELREILLRDKAPEFLATSPKGTVPVLVDGETVIEESRDIMLWALQQNDPDGWLTMPEEGHDLIDEADGPFKTALDRYKYATRYDSDPEAERATSADFLHKLDGMLTDRYLFGPNPSLADRAIQPFVRQFANTDRTWFDAQPWPQLYRWITSFLDSPEFLTIMQKYPVWTAGDPVTIFPDKDARHASKPSLSEHS